MKFDDITAIEKLSSKIGQSVRIAGWLYNSRASGKVQFIVLRDGTGLCQCVAEKSVLDEGLFEQLKHLGRESSVVLTGQLRADERSPGGVELGITDAQIVSEAVDYPITPKSHGIDFLLRHRHLHLRSSRQWAINRVRHTVIDAVRRFFNDNGFTLIDTPIITPVAGEEAASLFEVDYYGQPMHLTQTGQLYLEAAAMAHGKVYCFGPTFRAEKSKTRRHLTEFWMVEPEVAFVRLDDLLALAEDFVSFVVARVLKKNRAELETLEVDIATLEKIQPPFYRLTYSQAVDILTGQKAQDFLAGQLEEFQSRKAQVDDRIAQLEAQQGQSMKKWKADKIAAQLIELRSELGELEQKIENNPVHARLAAEFRWGKDLGGSDETIISQMHDKPVFITHYPRQAKAFYMKKSPEDERVVENFDLIAPAGFGEIIGGSMREDNYEALLQRINEHELDPDNYLWYLDLRKYGSVPHGGFGLGIERTVAWLGGQRHIRQCIPFPRMMDKVYI